MDNPTAQQWHSAFTDAVAAVSELGGAKPGDRTMIDALAPAVDALGKALAAGQPGNLALKDAAEAARRGADDTAGMVARLGRASYLGERATGIPDGGAVAVAIWLEAIASANDPQHP